MKLPVVVRLAVVRWIAFAFAVVVALRVVTYPFWAAGASEEDLRSSWGGPTAVGATLVHWLVGAVIIAVCLAIMVATKVAARRLRDDGVDGADLEA